MWKRTVKVILAAIPLFLLSTVAEAGLPPAIEKALESTYPAAVEHKGLKTAHEQPDPAKLRGFVVVEKGGIPAERARFFISFQEYDYRGSVVDLTKGEEISTRRGKIYTYLQRGDVMAIAQMTSFGRTVYFKLLSADVYVPGERRADKRFSRVTVMLGFTFPKEVFKADDADAVISALREWLKPFASVEAAESYAKGIRATPSVAAAPEPDAPKAGNSPATRAEQDGDSVSREATEDAAGKVSKVGGAEGEETSTADGADKLKALEDKIDSAKKQMEEAEKEMRMLREEQKKLK